MSSIDIRTDQVKVIDNIIFADSRGGEDPAYLVNKLSKSSYVGVIIIEGDDDLAYIRIEDIDNLIKALQKAQELGWG